MKKTFTHLTSNYFLFDIRSLALIAGLLISINAWGQYSGTGTFTKITSIGDLTDGYYVIANESDGFAMNNTNAGSYFQHTSISPSSNQLTNPSGTIVWKIETNGGGKTIFNEASSKYVSYTGSSNAAYAVDNVDSDNQRWSFAYSSNKFTVNNLATPIRQLSYNSGTPRFACYGNTGQQELQLYKMEEATNDPLITVNPSTLTGFTYEEGSGPSAQQSFTVEGSNLEGDITITPPSNWEISTTSGGPFQTTDITLTESGGIVAETTIYTRLITGLSAGPYSGNIACASTNATTKNVAVSGSVTAPVTPSYIIISKVVDPSDVANAKFVEIKNIGVSAQSLDGYILQRQSNGGTIANVPLNDFVLQAGDIYIIANDNTPSFLDTYGCNANQLSGNVNGNGDDGYFLYDPFNVLVDSYGVLNEDGTGKAWEYTDSKALRNSVTQANPVWTASEWTITSCNTSDFADICDDITLAVSLLDFDIVQSVKSIQLNWKTATEVNSSHFEIERATEANLFKGIGKVLAAGNSSEERSYTYTDEKPVKGNNYYRLKMIDNDGTYRYSEVVSAHFGNTNTGLILTPNLVHSSLKISFEAPVENGRVLIYNLNGKLVQSYLLAEGIDVLRVDLSDLVSGQYVIQYQSNQGSETVRFVKE